jgi:hypothetical protein
MINIRQYDVGEAMTRDDFIRQQDIVYLDRKHKKKSWRLHQNLAISLCTWAFSHPNDVYYFQDASEDNGIHVPFTIMVIENNKQCLVNVMQ